MKPQMETQLQRLSGRQQVTTMPGSASFTYSSPTAPGDAI